jgi:hypothetical protein
MAKAKRATQRKRVQRKPKAARGINYDDVRELALDLPAVEEGTSYGTPALKVRGKLMARLKEDGQTLVLRTTLADRARLLSAAPDVCYLTDHYVNYPWILIRLPQIDRAFLRELLAEAWRLAAPARLVNNRE